MHTVEGFSIIANKKGEKLLKEKKEINCVVKNDLTRLCVDVDERGIEKAITQTFTNVSNNTKYTVNLATARNSIRSIKVYVKIHETKTAKDYEDVYFTIHAKIEKKEKEIARFSYANRAYVNFRSEIFGDDFTITCHNLPTSGHEKIIIDVVWAYNL